MNAAGTSSNQAPDIRKPRLCTAAAAYAERPASIQQLYPSTTTAASTCVAGAGAGNLHTAATRQTEQLGSGGSRSPRGQADPAFQHGTNPCCQPLQADFGSSCCCKADTCSLQAYCLCQTPLEQSVFEFTAHQKINTIASCYIGSQFASFVKIVSPVCAFIER